MWIWILNWDFLSITFVDTFWNCLTYLWDRLFIWGKTGSSCSDIFRFYAGHFDLRNICFHNTPDKVNGGRTNITLALSPPSLVTCQFAWFPGKYYHNIPQRKFKTFPWPGIGRRNKLNAPVNYTVIYSVLRYGINGKYFQSDWSLISD